MSPGPRPASGTAIPTESALAAIHGETTERGLLDAIARALASDASVTMPAGRSATSSESRALASPPVLTLALPRLDRLVWSAAASSVEGAPGGGQLELGDALICAGEVFHGVPQRVVVGDIETSVHAHALLAHDDDVIGVLLVHDPIPETRRALLAAVSEHAARALFNLQLRRELSQMLRAESTKLSLIAETRSVLTEFDLQNVLAKLMELSISTVRGDAGCVVVYEEAGAVPSVVEWGLGEEVLDRIRQSDGERTIDRVVRDQQHLVLASLEGTDLSEETLALPGLHSLVALPLVGRQRVLGAILVVNAKATTAPDVDILRTVADLSATAVDSVLLHRKAVQESVLREQLEIAGGIQQAMLPKQAPRVRGATLAGRNVPCDESSGDYFDFISIDETRVGFVIADATGHGIGAALTVTLARAGLRALMAQGIALDRALCSINDQMEQDLPDHQFVTMFVGIVDTAAGTLSYVNAGHDPPMVLFRRRSGTVEHLESTGLPLGMFAASEFETVTISGLEPGDIGLVLTDGVHEAAGESGECFGKDRVLALLRERADSDPHQLVDAIYAEVESFTAGVPQADDITLVCMKLDAS